MKTPVKACIALAVVVAVGLGTALVMKGWLGPPYQVHAPTTLIATGTGLLTASAAAFIALIAGCFQPIEQRD